MTGDQIRKHNHCPCSIRWRLFLGRPEPTPGLFCKRHNTWIQWLKDHEALMLIDSGVEEEIYMPIVKTNRRKKKQVRSRK